MTLTDELKFLNKKINASQAQYDFESETIINIYILLKLFLNIIIKVKEDKD